MSTGPFISRRRARRRVTIGVAALAGLAIAPATALAGEASVAGTELRFTAGAGEANNLFVRLEPTTGTLLVSDYANAMTPGVGCTRLTERQVRCPAAGVATIAIDTGDGNDRIENRTSLPSTINAGDGDDVIVGGNVNDTIDAGPGNDTVSGRGGSDTVSLGDGDDQSVDNGGTRDVLTCGNGADQAVADPNDAVAADCEQRFETLPGQAPPPGAPTLPPPPASTPAGGGPAAGGGEQGASGGGPGGGGPGATTPRRGKSVGCVATRFRGSMARNRRRGTAGGDRMLGLGGPDVLIGLAGDDCLFGGTGNDRLSGGPGADLLQGGPGRDVLTGGSGSNRLYGQSGNDTIRAANGRRDRVYCGSGRDTVRADQRDRLVGCERVVRSF